MAAQDANALLAEAADVLVGADAGSLVNLGSVRNVVFTGDIIKIKVDSDNNGTILNKARINGSVSFEWLEAGDMANLETLFKGLVTLSSTAASLVSGASQVIGSPLVANVWTELTYQNGDGTQPTINSVTGSVDGALTLNDDFHIVQNPSTGKWGIIFNTVAIGPTLTTLTQTATINSDYTPAASKNLVGGGSMQTQTDRYVRLIAESEDSASITRQIDLAAAVANSPLLLQFLDTERAQDVGVMPVTLENNKGATWTITDEINAA